MGCERFQRWKKQLQKKAMLPFRTVNILETVEGTKIWFPPIDVSPKSSTGHFNRIFLSDLDMEKKLKSRNLGYPVLPNVGHQWLTIWRIINRSRAADHRSICPSLLLGQLIDAGRPASVVPHLTRPEGEETDARDVTGAQSTDPGGRPTPKPFR